MSMYIAQAAQGMIILYHGKEVIDEAKKCYNNPNRSAKDYAKIGLKAVTTILEGIVFMKSINIYNLKEQFNKAELSEYQLSKDYDVASYTLTKIHSLDNLEKTEEAFTKYFKAADNKIAIEKQLLNENRNHKVVKKALNVAKDVLSAFFSVKNKAENV
ncbi:MAG: hypothetical protein AMS24_05235 [Chlamydiae bacterium SM23_39]|nr:MAG: hypothetical protein AMS24_05235 [Chlamydiae bacterium SM23_39]